MPVRLPAGEDWGRMNLSESELRLIERALSAGTQTPAVGDLLVRVRAELNRDKRSDGRSLDDIAFGPLVPPVGKPGPWPVLKPAEGFHDSNGDNFWPEAGPDGGD